MKKEIFHYKFLFINFLWRIKKKKRKLRECQSVISIINNQSIYNLRFLNLIFVFMILICTNFYASFICLANKSKVAFDIYLFVRPEWIKTGDSDSRESKWKIRLWLCKSMNYTSELIVSNAQIVS